MSTTLSPLKKAWYKWKALHLPWRKRFLVGLDLQGNTFWEFRDTLSSHKNRMRRIVQYPPSAQYSDLNISPQWHQWLRHTRQDPPSITEQSQDLVRQKNLKVLAAAADARWAAKPSFLDAPGKTRRGQPLPATEVGRATIETPAKEGVKSAVKAVLEHKLQGNDKTVIRATDDHKREESEMMDVPEKIRHPYREGAPTEKGLKEDPRKQARGGPSEEWQPASWDGNMEPAKR